MDKKIKDLILVIISNILNLAIASAVGFLIPELLDLEVYAEYKIFTFFITYISLTHLGSNDGLIIKTLGKSKKDLESSNEFSSMFWIQLFLNILFSTIFMLLSLLFFNNVVYIFVIIMILPGSLDSYFRTVVAANMEFKFRFVIDLIDKLIIIIGVLMLYYIEGSYLPVVLTTILSKYFITFVKIIYYKKAIFKKFSIINGIKRHLSLIFLGIPMLSSYFVSLLAMGLDRIFIQNNNSLTEYAYYAFAMGMISLVVGIITSSGTVILPFISRMGSEMRKTSYEVLSNFMNVVTGLSSLGLIIFPYFITLVIPKMEATIILFYYLFPIIVFKIQYSMKQRQYFFMYKKTYQNLIANLSLLLLVFIFNMIVLLNNYGYEYYAFSSLISFVIWNIGVEVYFNRFIKVRVFKNIMFSIILSISIIYLALDFENIMTMLYFILMILGSIAILYGKFIRNVLLMIIKKDISYIK